MANVAHSSLTGSDLHEPKGVAAASDNTVARASSGAVSWGKLTQDNCTFSANPFGQALLHVRDEKASGTAAGSFVVANWNTRTLNTTSTNEISGASLGGNQITLPAGTYFIYAKLPYVIGTSATVKARLRNVTDGSDTIVGSSEMGASASGTSAGGNNYIMGRFTIASQKIFELQHYASAAGSMGITTSTGLVEVYAEALIWRIV